MDSTNQSHTPMDKGMDKGTPQKGTTANSGNFMDDPQRSGEASQKSHNQSMEDKRRGSQSNRQSM